MKRWASLLLTLPLLFLSGRVLSEDNYKAQVVGPFGSLNNTDRPYAIPADKAQDLLNVDLTPGGKSVKKRKGYSSAFSLSVTTNPTHGSYKFYESGGSDVVLYFYDRNLASSISGVSPTVLFATGTLNATYQCADSAGFAYCNSTARTITLKTNGTTTTNITVTSTGTMIAITPERMVTSGFSEAPNRIDFSKSSDFTTSTPGGNPTDPITFTITAPGAKVTHIVYAHGRIYWFKDTSFGYILEGPTHSDWVVRTVNPSIGTLYNTSIFRDDILYFQAQDGHFYAWDGTSLTKMSRDIQSTISLTQGRTSNSWTQTTAADWNAGVFDWSVYADTTTTSGTLSTVFPEPFSAVRDGSSSTRNVWKALHGAAISAGSAISAASLSDYVSGNQLNFSVGNTESDVIRTTDRIPKYDAGTTFYMEMPSYTGSSNLRFVFLLSTTAVSTYGTLLPSGSNQQGFWYFTLANATTTSNMSIANGCGAGAVALFDGSYTAPALIKFFLSSTVYDLQINGVRKSSGTHTCTMGETYAYLFHTNFTGGTGSASSVVDNFSVVPQTFTFQSAVKNSASLTSWDSFQTTTLNTGGTQTFSIRAATTIFTVNATTPVYASVTPGSVPTVSTGTYFQIKDLFSTTSTNTVALYDFTQGWFEGSASDKTYAIYHDNALWWSVASGAGATNNNKIIKYDMLNQGYLLYDIAANDMYVRNQSLYFGSPTAGTIFKYGDTDNDNGAAINGYWQSRDFFGDSPFIEKDFWQMGTAAYGTAGTNLNVTYTVNGSSAVAYAVPLTNSGDTFIKRNVNFPFGTTGTTINLKFSNSSVDSPFEIFGSEIDYTDRRWFVDDN